MKKINNKILDESIGLLLMKLSVPPMAGMIVFSILTLADTFFIAQLGSQSMAALTLCIPIYSLVVSLASGTGVGLTSVISRVLGDKDVKYADNAAWHGILISFIYGIVFMWIGLKNIDYLLILFGCTPEIFALSKNYLIINLLACTFTFPAMIIANIIQGEGNTIIPMVTLLVGMGLNVILDPILMFGFGPIKAMGLNGAALAGVFAQFIITLFLILKILKKKEYLPWSIKNFRPSLKVLADIYIVAIPSTIMEILGVVVMVLLNRIVAGFGITFLATLGIFLRVRSLFFMSVYGLSQGTLPIVGFAYGARKNDRVKEAIIKSMVISLIFTIISWIVIQLYPAFIMKLFSNDSEIVKIGVNCMRLATVFLPVMGPIIIFYTVLQAMGKGMTAMWLSIIRQGVLFLPLFMILPCYLGINGVWWSFSLSELLSGLLTSFFLVKLWRELQTRRKLRVVMLFKPQFIWNRLAAWLKW